MESYFKTFVIFHLRLCERLLFFFLGEESRNQMMMYCHVAMPGDPSSVWRRVVTLVTTSVAIMMTYCLPAAHPSSFSSWSCSFHSGVPVTDKDFLSFLIFPFRVFRFPLGETIFPKKNRIEKYLLKIHYTCLSGTAGRRTATCGCTCWCWATRCAGARSRHSASAAWRPTRRPAAPRSVQIFSVATMNNTLPRCCATGRARGSACSRASSPSPTPPSPGTASPSASRPAPARPSLSVSGGVVDSALLHV